LVRKHLRLGPPSRAVADRFSNDRQLGIAHVVFAQNGNSGEDFGKNIDAVDTCADPDAPVSVFEANDRGLAAGPLFFTQTKFCRKHEHDFDLAAECDLLIGVQEDACHAEVAGNRGLLLVAFKGCDRSRNLCGYALASRTTSGERNSVSTL